MQKYKEGRQQQTLKRVRSETSNREDHGDQERIKCILAIEGVTSQRVGRKIVKSSNYQDCPDLIATVHNNPIVHISDTGKESKNHASDHSKNKVAALKTVQAEFFGSRKIV